MNLSDLEQARAPGFGVTLAQYPLEQERIRTVYWAFNMEAPSPVRPVLLPNYS